MVESYKLCRRNGILFIGKNIKKLRKAHHWTQKDLSLQLGLTPKMISFYENDERIPPADILIKLSQIFDVSTDFLLGVSNIRQSTTDLKTIMVNSEEDFLLSQYKKLDKEFKEIIISDINKYIKLQKYKPTHSSEKKQA